MAVYFIQHTKADSIKFVGHLDLQNALQRNLSRAGLNVAFSKGFNPHILMSSAQPLSVGMSSEAEYLYVELLDAPLEKDVQKSLNATAPDGIRYLKVRQMDPTIGKPMALLDLVKTKIRFPSSREFAKHLEAFMADDSPILVEVTNKKGVSKQRDLRPLILPGAEVSHKEGYTDLVLKTMAGNPNHLNLNHLIDYLKQHMIGLEKNRFIHIKRLEMYHLKDGQYVSLGEI